MSTQPKPTVEWTVEDNIARFCTLSFGIEKRPELYRAIADAHNAALADAKTGGWLSQEALDEYAKIEAEHRELQQQFAATEKALSEEVDCVHKTLMQLAAEREKVQALVDEIIKIRDHVKGYGERPPTLFRVEEMCDTALAKVKVGK